MFLLDCLKHNMITHMESSTNVIDFHVKMSIVTYKNTFWLYILVPCETLKVHFLHFVFFSLIDHIIGAIPNITHFDWNLDLR